MSNPIPTFRSPEVGESAFGYCESISRAHGWSSSGELLKACAKNPVKNWFAYKPEVGDAIQAHIAPLAIHERVGVETFEFNDDFMPQLKICTQCIEDGKPHLSKHQLPYFTHCFNHGTQLIDQCPTCESLIQSAQVTDCPFCSEPLANQLGRTENNYFYFAITLSKFEQFLAKLLLLAEQLIRPWDLINESVNWRKLNNKEIVSAMEFAFSMLTNILGFYHYEDLLARRHSDNHALLHPLLSEKKRKITKLIWTCLELCDRDIPLIYCGVEENRLKKLAQFSQKVVPKKRLLIAGSDERAMEQHCTGPDLMRVLGVDGFALKKLIDLGICVPVSNTRVLSHAVFCFKSTVERIDASLPRYRDDFNNDYVCINHLSEIALKAYGLTKGELFLGILVGEVRACIDYKERMKGSRIYVQKQSLLDFLSAHPIINDHISIAELSDILIVPHDVIEQLLTAELGLFYAKYTKAGPLRIDRAHAEEFIRSYVCINRFAWLYKTMPSEVSKILKSSCANSNAHDFYSSSKNKMYKFLKVDSCISRNLHKLFNGFPKRLIQKKRPVPNKLLAFDRYLEFGDKF